MRENLVSPFVRLRTISRFSWLVEHLPKIRKTAETGKTAFLSAKHKTAVALRTGPKAA
jgi:hypothetical protein